MDSEYHGDTSELDKNLEDDIKVVLVTSLSKWLSTTYFIQFHPEVLMASVMEVNAHNNVVSNLEASFLPGVLNALPDKSYDDEKCLYILRDYQFRPVVAFDTSLDAEITLGKVLSRR